MFRIDVYKRTQDGNRGDYLFSAKYLSMKEAIEAKKTFILLSNHRMNLAPRDLSHFENIPKLATKTIEYNLLYAIDEKLILEKKSKEVQVNQVLPEFRMWKNRGLIIANPIEE